MGTAKVSNMLRMVKDYNLSPDERIMFDFLVVKQEDFGVGQPFRHSIAQVQAATKVTRHSQNVIIKKFTGLGFLQVGQDFYANNPYRTFFVDFSVLANPDVLSNIILPATETFSEFLGWIRHLSVLQHKERTSPDSSKKMKMKKRETVNRELLTSQAFKKMRQTWNDRIDFYNEGGLTNGKIPRSQKTHIQLPYGRNCKELLGKLTTIYDVQSIADAFLVYADKILTKELNPKNIMTYFLKYDEGDFPVVQNMINISATTYEIREW